MPVTIAPASASDADALTSLHLDVWEEAYGDLIDPQVLRERRRTRCSRVARWRDNILQGSAHTLLARAQDGRLLGFVSHGPGREQGQPGLPDLEVWALYVRSEAYGQGIGHALLNDAIGSAAAYLWVLTGNERAVAFYERQGFRLDGASKREPVGVEHRMVRTAR